MILEFNIKDDMPTVDVALKRLDMLLARSGRKSGVIKIIHGYGSTGSGGKIRAAVRNKLKTKVAAGKIKDYIPGEEFSMFHPATQNALASHHQELTRDLDYNRSNQGITLVILK
ncbi:MAG: Smr/MutS family protein [Clostridiales Family XIII bacterium]|nr:Smr/MutS family protein [Clostridiales Family XIII bacterium]